MNFKPNKEWKKAIQSNNLEKVKQLFQHQDIQNHEWSLIESSKLGNLDLVKFFIETHHLNINAQDSEYNRTSIYRACGNGKIDVVRYLHSKGADISIKQNEGASCLLIACQENHFEIVKFLIEEAGGFFLHDQKNNNDVSPFFIAIGMGRMEIAKYLIEKGATTENCIDKEGVTPLLYASIQGKLEAVKFLYSIGYDTRNTNQTTKVTTFLAAAERGHLPVLRFLAENGAMELKDNVKLDGSSPIHCAVSNGHFEVIKYLVSIECDLNRSNNHKTSLFLAASLKGNLEIMKYLIENCGLPSWQKDAPNSSGVTPFRIACQRKRLDMVEWLHRIGCDTLKVGKDGWTNLHLAAFNASFDVIQYLVEFCGLLSQSNLLTNDGDSAMLLAVQSGKNFELIKYLHSIGCDMLKRNKKGMSPFLMACKTSNLETIKFLVENGALSNSTAKDQLVDEKGNTAILLALEKNKLDVVKYLHSINFDIFKANERGLTPLFLACQTSTVETIKWFLEMGAKEENENSATAFQMACFHGNLEVVKFLYSKGSDFRKQTNSGQSCLHYAAVQNHLEIVIFLIEIGIELNQQTKNGATPFLCAVDNGNVEIAQCLVNAGCDLNGKLKDRGRNAMHLVSEKGHLQLLKFLVEKAGLKSQISEKDNHGMLPIHLASKLDILKYLISLGSDLNALDDENRTPIFCAASIGNLPILKFLIFMGADFNCRDKEGQTPFSAACWNQKIQIVKYLHEISDGSCLNEQDNEGATPISFAAFKGDLELVKYLVSEGADFNQRDKGDRSPFWSACGQGKLDVVKYLLSIGCQTEYVKSTTVSNFFHTSVHSGQFETMKYLISMGYSYDFKQLNSHGMVPLLIAIHFEKDDIVKYLLSIGAKVDVADKEGTFPLWEACSVNRLDFVKLLIQNGARKTKNQRDQHGVTPLQVAVIKKHWDIVKYLVSELKCDVNIQDNDGKTSLFKVVFAGELDLVKLMIEMGGDVHLTSKRGETMLSVASRFGHKSVYDYLLPISEKRNVVKLK